MALSLSNKMKGDTAGANVPRAAVQKRAVHALMTIFTALPTVVPVF